MSATAGLSSRRPAMLTLMSNKTLMVNTQVQGVLVVRRSILPTALRLILLPREDPRRPQSRTTTAICGRRRTPTMNICSLSVGRGYDAESCCRDRS